VESNITLKVEPSQLLKKWHETEAKIGLYGVSMPQAQQSIEAFYLFVHEVLARMPSFSIVLKNQDIEVTGKGVLPKGEHSHLVNTPVNTDLISQTFEKFKIQRITFHRELTLEELIIFFNGLHMSSTDAKRQNSLAEHLKKNRVFHIKLETQRYGLLKDGNGDAVQGQSSLAEEALKDAHKTTGINNSITQKVFESAWESYLEGKLGASGFILEHAELIELAQNKPELLVQALKQVVAKQQEIETFLANLERKLLDVGFSEEAVEDIQKTLVAPPQVSIGEDELARLRQIEKDFLSNPDNPGGGLLDKRLERSLSKIERLKKNLSDVKERGEASVRQSSQGVMVLDKHGRILEINQVAHKVLGVSNREAKGKLLEDVIKDHHMLSVVSDWEAETEDYTPKHVMIQASNDETMDTIRESSLVIENENGRSIGGIYALQNVVRQEELKSRKNDILDVLGHDLRAPLAVVKQNVSLITDCLNLPEELSDAKQETLLGTCAKNIERLEVLINKILDVRQLETGKIILKRDTTPSNTLIEEAVRSLDSWAEDKNIKVDVHMEPLPDLYCDPERIYQVVTNLVSNAIKFTDEGGSVKVEGITACRGEDECVEISVIDSGIGINKDDMKRVFNKYEQVSLQSPSGVSGLGLGLSTCKTIVEMHGGKIWVNSHYGEGSTFTFQLPLLPSMY